MGYPTSNHYIVTRYEDERQNIGYHFDKPKSIAPNSLITVVKTGSHGRRFQLRDRAIVRQEPGEAQEAFNKRKSKAQDRELPFFDKDLPTGTAVVMTLEANLRTQHGVPEVEKAGPSGSWVARSIVERVPCARLA